MKKTFKKIISLVLVLVMLMSVGVMGVAAEDSTATDSSDDHGSFFSLFVRFAMEIFNFFKYIFHDVWLGKPPV